MITAKPEMTAHYLGVVRGRCDGQPIVDVMTGKVLPGICRTYVPCQLDGNHAYFDLGGYSWRVPLDGTACERLPRTHVYVLHLSKSRNGFGKPTVPAIRSAHTGHYIAETGTTVKPDSAAIRAALPHYYRKAFDRACGAIWFDKHDDNKPAYITLRDARGRYLNTVYCLLSKMEG
jgi:hypothetical protein